MRIYYVMPIRVPSEKAHTFQIVKMCEGLANCKNEVTLLIGKRRNFPELRKIDPFSYYNLKRNFQIKKVNIPDLIWLNNYLPKRLHYIMVFFYTFILGMIAFIYCKKKGVGLVLTRDSRVAYIMSFFFKTVYEVHSYSKNKLERFMEKSAYKRLAVMIVLTKHLRDRYLSIGFDSSKIKVIADGVDLEMFDIRVSKEEAKRRVGFREDEKIIGYIGNFLTLDMEKGLVELILSSRYIKVDNYKIVMVGGVAEVIKRYEELIEREGLERDKFIFWERKVHREMPLLLKSFDCCAMPFPWTEHFAYYMSPLKMFEYMASRRPIITTDLPSIREILDEECSVIVSVGDVEALGEGISKILIDEDFAMKLADEAYKRVLRYTWEERGRSLFEALSFDNKQWIL